MQKLNQVFTKEGVKKIWKYYKFFFIITFLFVSVVGIFLSMPRQKEVYTTNMEILLSVNSSPESSGESDRASVINTYKDLLISKSAISEAENALTKASLNTEGVFESLGLSQNSNSQLMDLEINRSSKDEGTLIGESLNRFAEKSIKNSYPDKNVSVQYHFYQSESKGTFNVKLALAAIVIGLFMGIVILIIVDTFSTRILSSESLEPHRVKVLGRIKSE